MKQRYVVLLFLLSSMVTWLITSQSDVLFSLPSQARENAQSSNKHNTLTLEQLEARQKYYQESEEKEPLIFGSKNALERYQKEQTTKASKKEKQKISNIKLTELDEKDLEVEKVEIPPLAYQQVKTVCATGVDGVDGCEYIGGDGVQQAIIDSGRTPTKILLRAGVYKRTQPTLFTFFDERGDHVVKAFAVLERTSVGIYGEGNVTIVTEKQVGFALGGVVGAQAEFYNLNFEHGDFNNFRSGSNILMVAGSKARIIGNRFWNDGVNLQQDSQAIVAENIFEAQSPQGLVGGFGSFVEYPILHGVKAKNNSNVSVLNNQFKGEHGVSLSRESKARIVGNSFVGDAIGVNADFDAKVHAEKNVFAEQFYTIDIGAVVNGVIDNTSVLLRDNFLLHTFRPYFSIQHTRALIEGNYLKVNKIENDPIFKIQSIGITFGQKDDSSNIVRNNIIDAAGSGILSSGDTGRLIVKNNTIYNSQNGITVSSFPGDKERAKDFVVEDNIVQGDSKVYVVADLFFPYPIWVNYSMSSLKDSERKPVLPPTSFSHNISWLPIGSDERMKHFLGFDEFPEWLEPEHGNQILDPRFTNSNRGDARLGDFTLEPDSPALTASTTGGEVGAYGGDHPFGKYIKAAQIIQSVITADGASTFYRTCPRADGKAFDEALCTQWNQAPLSNLLPKTIADENQTYRGYSALVVKKGDVSWLTQSLLDGTGTNTYTQDCPLDLHGEPIAKDCKGWKKVAVSRIGLPSGAKVLRALDAFVFKQNNQEKFAQSLIADDGKTSYSRICDVTAQGIDYKTCGKWATVDLSVLNVGEQEFSGISSLVYPTTFDTYELVQSLANFEGNAVYVRTCKGDNQKGISYGNCSSWARYQTIQLGFPDGVGFLADIDNYTFELGK